MPTLKNKKICEDVPPQLDLGPRPSFDSAHLDVPYMVDRWTSPLWTVK